MCSWQEYLLTYWHESTWKLFRSWWWWEQNSSSWQCSFKMKHMQNGRTASIERSVERKEINDIKIIWTNLGLACLWARKFYEDWMPHGWGTRQLCNILGGAEIATYDWLWCQYCSLSYHPRCQYSFLGRLVQRFSSLGRWTSDLWTHSLLSTCNKCFHCSSMCVAFTCVWEIQYCKRIRG